MKITRSNFLKLVAGALTVGASGVSRLLKTDAEPEPAKEPTTTQGIKFDGGLGVTGWVKVDTSCGPQYAPAW